jgi:hypothetical protein
MRHRRSHRGGNSVLSRLLSLNDRLESSLREDEDAEKYQDFHESVRHLKAAMNHMGEEDRAGDSITKAEEAYDRYLYHPYKVQKLLQHLEDLQKTDEIAEKSSDVTFAIIELQLSLVFKFPDRTHVHKARQHLANYEQEVLRWEGLIERLPMLIEYKDRLVKKLRHEQRTEDELQASLFLSSMALLLEKVEQRDMEALSYWESAEKALQKVEGLIFTPQERMEAIQRNLARAVAASTSPPTQGRSIGFPGCNEYEEKCQQDPMTYEKWCDFEDPERILGPWKGGKCFHIDELLPYIRSQLTAEKNGFYHPQVPSFHTDRLAFTKDDFTDILDFLRNLGENLDPLLQAFFTMVLGGEITLPVGHGKAFKPEDRQKVLDLVEAYNGPPSALRGGR